MAPTLSEPLVVGQPVYLCGKFFKSVGCGRSLMEVVMDLHTEIGANVETTPNGGPLGSRFDEERSKLRYLV